VKFDAKEFLIGLYADPPYEGESMTEHQKIIAALVANPVTGAEAHAAVEIKTLRSALQRHIDLAMRSVRGLLLTPCVIEYETKDADIGEPTRIIGLVRHSRVTVMHERGLQNDADVAECHELMKSIGTGTHGN
jgi:hypothetical protein